MTRHDTSMTRHKPHNLQHEIKNICIQKVNVVYKSDFSHFGENEQIFLKNSLLLKLSMEFFTHEVMNSEIVNS